MATKTTADLYAPPKPPGLGAAAVGLLLTVIVAALAAIVSSAAVMVLVVVVCLGLTIGLVVAMHRSWQKKHMMPSLLLAAWSEVLRMQLRESMLTMSRFQRGSLLRVGPPRTIKLQDPMRKELPRQELEDAASMALGARYRLDLKRTKPTKRVVFQLAAPQMQRELSAQEAMQERITRGARELLGPETKVALSWEETLEEEDYLTAVEITGFDGSHLALSGKRNQIITRLRTRLPQGNFSAEANPQQDSITFARAKPLPALVLPPARQAPQIRSHSDYRKLEIPFGVAAGGGVATWHLRKLPHYLGIGGTGGGKTIWEHGAIQACTQACMRVWLLDGKGIEFIGYRDWPNVEFLAQDVESQVRLLHLAHETMLHRYELIREGKASMEDMDEIILVIDELTSFKAIADQLYRRTKEKGSPAKSELMEWFGNLLRLARSCKIHLLVGMQRPDTTIIDGEARDNMGGRISLGPLSSKEGSIMMWDNAAIGVQIPRIPGRAVGLVDNHPTQIQATYNANPDPKADDYHAGMIAAARPKISVFGRKRFGKPITEIDDETGMEKPAMWTDIINAPVLDENGQEIQLDPVMTEEARQARSAPLVADDRPYELQVAAGLEDIDRLFDPLMSMRFGSGTVRALRALFPASGDGEELEARIGAGAGAVSVPLVSDGDYEPRRVDLLEAGDRVLIDDEQVMLSSVEPSEDDPEQFELEGYSNDGVFVAKELGGVEELMVSAGASEEMAV
ncbi:FtsK/SpoIIIE domain-containing protein [Kocuria palustris]|uniref:FtsK/SpoIIIE domain-containing protein n=1 Tax=Kocuria palustris TaxID=71999 RepID=UPI00204482C9|nr:FtsK/SpoIIIE domain-containing protein [Kocuria palustris]MCM3332665.1 hypothetical protein [Kocuria palustris]